LKKISLDDILSNVKKHKKIFLFHKSSEKLISSFKKKIKVISAGGGVVKNSFDETLFIFRGNKWDLPKGKKDKGETIDETALREVKEETGITDLKIIDFRTITYHLFKKNSEYCLKETSWYNMVSNFDGKFTPEIKEDITKVVWKNENKIRKIKNYRNQILDSKIRKQRTIKESQMISQVKKFGIPTPLVYFVNLEKTSILMQEIPGTPVHDLSESKIISLSKEIGKLVGLLHKNGVMHGDLTTSNFILFKNIIYMIDFGLSQNTIKSEDHAVDLRLIKEILNSAHAKIMQSAWKNFLTGYKSIVGVSYHAKIVKLVSEIESRGRYAQVV